MVLITLSLMTVVHFFNYAHRAEGKAIMAKQIGKPTLEQKIAAAKAKAAAQQTKMVKQVKPKGPCPTSYHPNHERIKKAHNMDLAQSIAEARKFFPKLVDGALSSYLVGINTGGTSEGHYFILKTLKLPPKDVMPACELLVIEGDVTCYGKEVYIPHYWLFKKLGTIPFVYGHIGQVQREMLNFLQSVLYQEIDEAKRVRWEAMETAKAAKKAAGTASTAGADTSKNVVSIQSVVRPYELNDLIDLVPGKEGFYDLSDIDAVLIVEFVHNEVNGDFFRVKKISLEHHLSNVLVATQIVALATIVREVPLLDEHIRGMLAFNGVHVRTQRYQPRSQFRMVHHEIHGMTH